MTALVPSANRGSGYSDTEKTSYMSRDVWMVKARCRGTDPESLFVKGTKQRQATAICQECAVAKHCLVEALDSKIQYGVWGGLTERQRRALLRKYPDVTSWRNFFADKSENWLKELPF